MENTKAKNVIIIVVVVLLIGILGFLGFYLYNNKVIKVKQDNENTINNLQNEIITLRNENNELKEKIQQEENLSKDISKAQVTGVSNKWYTGSAIKQSLTVTFEEKKLVEKTDYTVSYANNVKAGTAVITIKGIGEYTGTKEVTFKVLDQYANYKGIISNKVY